jgi:hypothetical protein
LTLFPAFIILFLIKTPIPHMKKVWAEGIFLKCLRKGNGRINPILFNILSFGDSPRAFKRLSIAAELEDGIAPSYISLFLAGRGSPLSGVKKRPPLSLS